MEILAVSNLTVVTNAASMTIGSGQSLRQQSFQERAHASSVGDYVELRRAASTEPLEDRQAPAAEVPEQLPAEQPAPPSIPR